MGHDGATYERALVNWLQDRGWYAQRAGASGGGTDEDRVDIIALHEHNGTTVSLAIELKSWKKGHGRFPIPDEEDEYGDVQQTQNVADKSGALGLLVIWPNLNKHPHRYAFLPEMLKENKKSYTATKDMTEDAPSFEEIVEALETAPDDIDIKEYISQQVLDESGINE